MLVTLVEELGCLVLSVAAIAGTIRGIMFIQGFDGKRSPMREWLPPVEQSKPPVSHFPGNPFNPNHKEI